MTRLSHLASFLILLWAKAVGRTFYRFEVSRIGAVPEDPWQGIRLAAILNHTSLYEWLLAAVPPNSFLRQLATRSVLPSAEKTMRRPVVGTFYRFLAGNVVTVTRKRDSTWEEVLASIGADSMVLIAPEGRMKRPTGLDLEGKPMTMRGGIADILRILGEGRMLLAYSGGLHHVQAPGEWIPRLFKTIRVALEVVDIADYIRARGEPPGSEAFKQAVKADLERRRDLYCPPLGEPSRS